MNTLQLISTLELELIYGLVAIGIYLTFRIIDFPDLITVDGSLALGGSVKARLYTIFKSKNVTRLQSEIY